ncbi:DUF3025 domain-containing protein [Neisseria sp. Ec49-e6-T10]|uniref:DUF3025 domain-containing protein n=1 Tax=Neisseria sp. Ec49-e6-T10 TaxID=3140744 RepID=UPI003EBEB070
MNNNFSPLFSSVQLFIDTLGLKPFQTQNDCDQLLNSARKINPDIPTWLKFGLDHNNSTLYYEECIQQTGIVPTRSNNWHDWFNALIWCAFPKTKTAITNRHNLAINQGEKKRGPIRDSLTLLDESGILIPYTEQANIDFLQNHEWQNLFVHQKQNWGHTIDAWVIGHATLEKGLAPYIGWCGKALPIKVDVHFFQLSRENKNQYLDNLLAKKLVQSEFLSNTKSLFPLPVLGIPGWHTPQDEAFYANRHYFRKKAE